MRTRHLLLHNHPLVDDGKHPPCHKIEKCQVTGPAFVKRLQHFPQQRRPKYLALPVKWHLNDESPVAQFPGQPRQQVRLPESRPRCPEQNHCPAPVVGRTRLSPLTRHFHQTPQIIERHRVER